MKHLLAGILAALSLFCAGQSAPLPPEKPVLVVGIVFQEMHVDYLGRYAAELGNEGFRRLSSEGFQALNASYDHFVLQRAPGHASLVTGCSPSVHGIVADSWLSGTNGEKVLAEKGFPGPNTPSGRIGPGHLMATTLGDEMRLSTFNRSKVVAISPDPKAAVMMGGHLSDRVFWFEEESGHWVTGPAYSSGQPPWVSTFNAKKLPDLYLSRFWNTTLPLGRYRGSRGDTLENETGFQGGNRTFPYDLKEIRGKHSDCRLLGFTPFLNTLCFDFAIESIVQENLGKGDETDLLLLSVPAATGVGQLFTPQSVETEDTYLRLDHDLGFFLRFLAERFGQDRVLVFVTSDLNPGNAGPPVSGNSIPGGLFYPDRAFLLTRGYLNASLGPGDWLSGFMNQQVYLNQPFIRTTPTGADQVSEEVRHILAEFSGCASVYASNSATGRFDPGFQSRIQANYFHGRSGDLFYALLPGWKNSEDSLAPGFGLSGAQNLVPLYFWGWKIRKSQSSRPMSMTDVAPTLARIIGTGLPSGSTGKLIQEILDRD